MEPCYIILSGSLQIRTPTKNLRKKLPAVALLEDLTKKVPMTATGISTEREDVIRSHYASSHECSFSFAEREREREREIESTQRLYTDVWDKPNLVFFSESQTFMFLSCSVWSF